MRPNDEILKSLRQMRQRNERSLRAATKAASMASDMQQARAAKTAGVMAGMDRSGKMLSKAVREHIRASQRRTLQSTSRSLSRPRGRRGYELFGGPSALDLFRGTTGFKSLGRPPGGFGRTLKPSSGVGHWSLGLGTRARELPGLKAAHTAARVAAGPRGLGTHSAFGAIRGVKVDPASQRPLNRLAGLSTGQSRKLRGQLHPVLAAGLRDMSHSQGVMGRAFVPPRLALAGFAPDASRLAASMSVRTALASTRLPGLNGWASLRAPAIHDLVRGSGFSANPQLHHFARAWTGAGMSQSLLKGFTVESFGLDHRWLIGARPPGYSRLVPDHLAELERIVEAFGAMDVEKDIEPDDEWFETDADLSDDDLATTVMARLVAGMVAVQTGTTTAAAAVIEWSWQNPLWVVRLHLMLDEHLTDEEHISLRQLEDMTAGGLAVATVGVALGPLLTTTPLWWSGFLLPSLGARYLYRRIALLARAHGLDDEVPESQRYRRRR